MSGGGAVDVVVLCGERRFPPACPFGDLNLHRHWGGEQAVLSLSLSDVKQMSCWNVLEVKKKIKEGGFGHLCGGEKQEKEKKK